MKKKRKSVKRKVKRRRLRVKRLLICILVFISFIFLVVFGVKFMFNSKKYKSITETNSVRLYLKKFNVWEKTIDYIKENGEDITFNMGKYKVVMPAKNITNNMNLSVSISNKKVDYALFDKVKSLYITKNKIIENSKSISVKLPGYLNNKDLVDIYGVNDNKATLIKSVKPSKYVKIDIDKEYDDYFITYIKTKEIDCGKNIKLEVGDSKELNIKIYPTNSTYRELEYKISDNKIINIKDNSITAKKVGKATITAITSDNTKCSIDVTVNKKTKKVSKEEDTNKTKKGFKIEVKDGITYIDGIMIVNKSYSLPSTYDPGKLSDEFMNAFYEMQAAARLDNIELFVASGYRSYEYQVDLYNYYVKKDGKELADTYSARPGYSEHQTGLTADINSADESFEGTKEAIWLNDNCYKYGFIVRYPKGKDEYTGYEYEPWHLRYVGKEFSNKIHEAGDISLEEYFGIESKYED